MRNARRTAAISDNRVLLMYGIYGIGLHCVVDECWPLFTALLRFDIDEENLQIHCQYRIPLVGAEFVNQMQYDFAIALPR